MEPPHDSGQSVTPAFEGWFANADGTYSILFGYFNRNMKQELDIPIGPDNKIEPAGPDQGQPTHFMTRRQWGVFTVTVPKDFGSQESYVDHHSQRRHHRDPRRPRPALGVVALQGRQWQHPAVHRIQRERPVRARPTRAKRDIIGNSRRALAASSLGSR